MLRKYQSVEKAEIVSPEGHDRIQDELHRVGKVSMTQMTPEERSQVSRSLDEEDD